MDSLSFLYDLIFPFLLFFIGLLGVLISKNIVRICISLLISVSAVCINFVFAEKFVESMSDGINKIAVFIFFMLLIQIVMIAFLIYKIYSSAKVLDIEKIEKRKRVNL